jgi:hypothetical protein
MIENERIIEQVVNNIIYEHLLSVNLSYLFLDWTKLNDAMLLQLKGSVRQYVRAHDKEAALGQ